MRETTEKSYSNKSFLKEKSSLGIQLRNIVVKGKFTIRKRLKWFFEAGCHKLAVFSFPRQFQIKFLLFSVGICIFFPFSVRGKILGWRVCKTWCEWPFHKSVFVTALPLSV